MNLTKLQQFVIGLCLSMAAVDCIMLRSYQATIPILLIAALALAPSFALRAKDKPHTGASPMQHRGMWIRRNLALPIGMGLATACTAFAWQLAEIDAKNYYVLEQMYLDGTPQFRGLLQDHIGDSINHWQYTDLINQYWTDARTLKLPSARASATDRSRARAALWEAVNQRRSRRAAAP